MSDNLAYKDEFYRFREELIGGEVVMMSPPATNHNRISYNINRIFGNYLDGRQCESFGDTEIVYLTEEDHFIPDCMVVCDPDKIKEDGIYGAPDLVVEILSPSTARNDKTRKKKVYAHCGVREYWIVSPSDKVIDVYRSDGNEFVSHDVHTLIPDWELARMSEDERAAVETHFKCSLFDDLEISLEKIFYRTF